MPGEKIVLGAVEREAARVAEREAARVAEREAARVAEREAARVAEREAARLAGNQVQRGFFRRAAGPTALVGGGYYLGSHPGAANRLTGGMLGNPGAAGQQPQSGIGSLLSTEGSEVDIGGFKMKIGIGTLVGALGLGAAGAYMGGIIPAIALTVGGAVFGQKVLDAFTKPNEPANAPGSTPPGGTTPTPPSPTTAVTPPGPTPPGVTSPPGVTPRR